MELKQGYKQTEVGVIPENWDTITIFEAADRKKELFDDGDWIESEHITDRGIRLIQTGNIGIGKFVEKDIKKYIFQKSYEVLKCKNLKIGDLLLCRLAEPAGRSCIFPDLKDGIVITSVDVTIFRPNETIANRHYLNQYFTTKLWFNAVSENCGGTTHKRISRGALGRLKVPLPPLLEQTAIANALSDMDALIAQTEKLIEKKKAIKQGAMQELLKPKEGWVTKKFTEIVQYIHGKAHEQFIVENGKFEVVNSKFISTNGKVKKYSDVSFLTARQGDVLTVLSDLPNGKALAKCFYVEEDNKYAVNQRICIWRSSNQYSKFLYYFLNRHKYFIALDDGVSQTHILNGHIEKFEVTIPKNYEEQQKIADSLWDIDQELILWSEKLNKLKQQKQGMMQALLTGKIRLVS